MLKQLLTRSCYLLFKHETAWTITQQKRASVLFNKYPLLKKAYQYATQFRNIYENCNAGNAKKQFLEWIEEIKQQTELTEFNSAEKSIGYHLENILNFFTNRNANANAELFYTHI